MRPEDVGGKAYNLFRLTGEGFNVPAFKVVGPDIFIKWNSYLFTFIPGDLTEETYKVFDKQLDLHYATVLKSDEARWDVCVGLPVGPTFAVRSSGTEEDGVNSSFAGQFESYLQVSPQDVFEKVVECWRSRFSFRALSYIRNKGASEHFPLAVIVQTMIEAEKSGVMLTANVDLQEPYQTVISVTMGIGEALVSGECNADTYIVSQDHHKVLRTTQKMGEGNVLSSEEIKTLSEIALKIERAYGGQPQDIEWCFKGGKLYLLQTRPLTSWATLDKSSPLELWDSSNIGESYHGSVSPLTYSFSLENYQHLFGALLRDLGCSEDSLKASSIHLENLLGQYQGNLYYRLSNWKQLLIPVPGGSLFMRLLGPFIGSSIETGSTQQKNFGLDVFEAIGVVFKIFWRYTFRSIFTRSFEKKYAVFAQKKWDYLKSDQDEKALLESVRTFYDELNFWYMPTYNDFFSVIWMGLFEQGVKTVFSGRSALDQNAIKLGLIGATKGLGPVVELKKIVALCERSPQLVALLKSADPRALADLWNKQDPAFNSVRNELQAFLDHWGFRCEDELMLEATDLKEDPTLLFEQIQLHLGVKGETTSAREEQRILEGPRERLLFPLLSLAARRTKEHLETRESMRIKRSELFAIMRRYVKRLGKFWAAERVLERAEDIFYLHLAEIRATRKEDLKEIVAARKLIPVGDAPMRFYNGKDQVIVPKKVAPDDGKGIFGTPCFGGIVSGEVLFYVKGMSVSEMKGKILVTERSGPGHVSYFPHIKAMLVEKGSTLSHAVIAAREFGLPTIVGINDLSSKLAKAGLIEVNANTGEIIIKG